MKNNYKSLMLLSYKKYNEIILLMLLLIFLISSLFIKIYNCTTIKGLYNSNSLILEVPIINSDGVINGNYIKINNKRYYYHINNISNLVNTEGEVYQQITISIKNRKFKENEIVELTFYYNKQSIANKIMGLIF